MRNYLFILLAAALTLTGCVKQKPADENRYTDITGLTLENQELSLSDLVGKTDYVLLDFWASWCGPCRRFAFVLRSLYYDFGGDRLEILSCSVDQEEQAWREAMFEERFPWQSIREDADHPCSDKYNVQFIPHTVLIDREGHIVGVNLEEPELREILLGDK